MFHPAALQAYQMVMILVLGSVPDILIAGAAFIHPDIFDDHAILHKFVEIAIYCRQPNRLSILLQMAEDLICSHMFTLFFLQ